MYTTIFNLLIDLVAEENYEIKTAVNFVNHKLKLLLHEFIINNYEFDMNEFMFILIENFIKESHKIK